MGAYALVGVRLGDYTKSMGISEVDKFIVLDLINLSKIEVDLKFLREHAKYFCVIEDTIDYEEFGLMSTGIFKNKVYVSESEFYCCDSEDDLDELDCDTFDFLDNGVVIVNDNIIGIGEEQVIVYESSITDKLCVVYKPYTNEIEMCYRDKVADDGYHNRKYSVFYSVGSNLKFADTLSDDEDGIFMHNIINSSDSEPFTLYNDCVMDTFYNLAECRDNVFRIGSVHWTDDWIEQDNFIVENGCQVFFIVAECLELKELILPPSIKVFGCSDEASLKAEKLYLCKALKCSRVADMIYKSISNKGNTLTLEIGYY